MASEMISILSGVFCSFAAIFGIVVILRTIYIKHITKTPINPIVYWSTLATIIFYTLTIFTILISYIIHIGTNTLLTNDESDYYILNHCYVFLYVFSMVFMLIVFLSRIQVMFPMDEQRVKYLWILIIFMGIFGLIGVILDIFKYLIPLYIVAVFYIGLLFMLSLYLLYLFTSKLKVMFESYQSQSYENNTDDAMDLYIIIVRTTIIAKTAIFSTFLTLSIGGVVDVISFWFNNNTLQYIQRNIFIIDAIIGILSMSLTFVQNVKFYKLIFGCLDKKYFKDGENTKNNVKRMNSTTNTVAATGSKTPPSNGTPSNRSPSNGSPSTANDTESNV